MNMKAFKYFTAASVVLLGISVTNTGFAFNQDIGDLEITMEVVGESSRSASDIVNKIELPSRVQERARNFEQVRDTNENGDPEGDVDQAREMIREMQMHQEEVQEQQTDSLNDVGEITQDMRGSRELVEDAREQGVEALDDIRQKNQKYGR